MQSWRVSFDVFLQAFRGGEPIAGDGDAATRILEPLIADRGDGWARIATPDGEADVFGLDQPEWSLMLNRCGGHAIWNVIVDVARAAGFVVMPIGHPTCVLSEAMVKDLPQELAEDTVIIQSGDELLRVITSA